MNYAFSKIWILIIILIFIGGGILAWQYLIPKIEVRIPKVDISEKTIQEKTADWRIYQNQEYGYEFKMPADWQIVKETKETGYVRFTDRTSDEDQDWNYLYTLSVSPADDLSLREYFEKSKKETKKDLGDIIKIFEEKSVTVDNLEAIQMIFGESPDFKIVINRFYIQTWVLKDDLIFELGVLWTPDYPRKIINKTIHKIEPVHLETYNIILSTFKFIKEDETADWKTYRSEEYGFELKYHPYYQVVGEWKKSKTESEPEKFNILFQALDEYLPKFEMWGISIYETEIKESVKINDLIKSISLGGETCGEAFLISQNTSVIGCRGEERPDETVGFFPREFYFISPQGFLFEIGYLHNNFYNNEAIINQILSTFRFSPH